ncbi:MAG: DUF4058 family protein [Planctomycetes bacterium]|nr:DUF4058 family protein [Planctomycetota bacterium]
MTIHDWTRVEAGIFHDFHHGWIEEIKRALNGGLLPEDYYALAEQHAAGFGPDVLTLQGPEEEGGTSGPRTTPSPGGGGLLLAPPKVRLTAETDLEFYRRKQSTVGVRHVSGDRVVAMVEIVSPGNKSSRSALRSFVEKATDLLDKRMHLLVLDLLPPSPRDPQGIHGAIWGEITGQDYEAPTDGPLTLVAYESGLTVRAYIEPMAVGGVLPYMPLYLEPGAYVNVPLDATYQSAFRGVPRRWQRVLEGPSR